MKKICVLFAVFAVMFLMVSCGGGSKEEGIYLGIIGFNHELHKKNIDFLTSSNMEDFHNFITELQWDDGTALYYADYKALDIMNKYNPVPPNLQKVALVTFTDGEDNSSYGSKDPEHYDDPEIYLDAINSKIRNDQIHGVSVEAYSIGLKSGDTGSNFMSKLKKLASEGKAFEVSDMEEVKKRFRIIAEELQYLFKTIDIDFKVLGNYSDGTRMRFTFDIYCDPIQNECEKNGKDSNLYIDVIYRRNGDKRMFDNFTYHGFSGDDDMSIECGSSDKKGYFPCNFENIKYIDIDTEIKQIELWKNDENEWKHENESIKKEETTINESKNSALIMLVLDCTTSLGVDNFTQLKEAGKEFITTLVNR